MLFSYQGGDRRLRLLVLLGALRMGDSVVVCIYTFVTVTKMLLLEQNR
jgi:hypothetical protein